jgi:hypothetical protein
VNEVLDEFGSSEGGASPVGVGIDAVGAHLRTPKCEQRREIDALDDTLGAVGAETPGTTQSGPEPTARSSLAVENSEAATTFQGFDHRLAKAPASTTQAEER